MESLAYSVTLTTINCGECGGVYAINERRRAQCYQEGTGWNCPYCKTQWGYYNDNENAKLKKQLDQERKFKEWAQQDARNQTESRRRTERKLKAQRGVATRLRNRIAKGACPCCRERFADLKAHMTEKHPDYTTKERL